MSKQICCLLLFSILLASASPVLASDQVVLKNGDRITGRVIEQSDEIVILETEYAGTVTISAGHVETIMVSTAANAAETIPVPAVNAARAVTAKAETAKPLPAVKANPKLFGGSRYYGIADGWEGNANVGFNYTSGNSKTSTMTTGIRAVKAGVNDNLTVYLRSLWHNNRREGTNFTTQNAVWGGARYDRNINDKMFVFASYDLERDRPKNLNFRSVVGAGFGHHTVKDDRTEFDVLLGGAWNRAWQVGDNTDSPEVLAGTSLKHRFNGRLKFQKTFTFYQNITDKAEYRFLFDTTLSADVTKRIGWYVSLGNRFNNDPIGNAEKNDVLFTTGMKWNFGKKK